MDPLEMVLEARRRQARQNMGELSAQAGVPQDGRAALLQQATGAMERQTPWQYMSPQQRAMKLAAMQQEPSGQANVAAQRAAMLVGPGVINNASTQRLDTQDPQNAELVAAARREARKKEAARLQATSGQRVGKKQAYADSQQDARAQRLAMLKASGRIGPTQQEVMAHQIALAKALNPPAMRGGAGNPLHDLAAQYLQQNPAMLQQFMQQQVGGGAQPAAPLESPPPTQLPSRRIMPDGTVLIGPPGQGNAFGSPMLPFTPDVPMGF